MINLHHHFRNRQFPAGNPIANALVVIAGIFVIGLSIVLGIVAFIALGTLLLVLAAIVGIRFWWFNRKLDRQRARRARHGEGPSSSGGRIEIIEGEYREVSRDASRRDD